MTDWTDERLTALSERVVSSEHVVRLSSGPSGAVAAYLPGGRVPGIRIRDERLEVHVVMAWTSTVSDVEQAVESAVAATVGADVVVDVVVDDIDDTADEGDSSSEAIMSAGAQDHSVENSVSRT